MAQTRGIRALFKAKKYAEKFLTTRSVNPALTDYCYSSSAPTRPGSATKPIIETCHRILSIHGSIKNGRFPAPKGVTTVTRSKQGMGQTNLYFNKNEGRVNAAYSKWLSWLTKTNGFILQSGGKTTVLGGTNTVGASEAVRAYIQLMRDNGIVGVPDTMLGWIEALFRLLDKDKIKYRFRVPDKKDTYREIEKEVSHDEFVKDIGQMSGFIKQLERGQLKARSCVCVSLPFKLMATAVEQLGEYLTEFDSAVKISTVGKLAKLRTSGFQKSGLGMGFTVDNSKWNEAMNVTAMMQRLKLMLSRVEDPAVKEAKPVLDSILETVNFFFCNKSILLGQGLSLKQGDVPTHYKDLEQFTKDCPPCDLRNQVLDILPFWDRTRNSIILTDPAMLMGLLNKCSTAYSYHSSPALHKLQSSDDAVHLVYANEADYTYENIMRQFEYIKAFEKTQGMNMADDKTYGAESIHQLEYNAVVIQGDNAINMGAELPGLLPMGKNPITDYNFGIQQLKEMRTKGNLPPQLTPLGLGIVHKEWSRAYNCAPIQGSVHQRGTFLQAMKDEGHLLENLHPCHGGKILHSTTNLHLDSIALGIEYGVYPEDYTARLLNPNSATGSMTTTSKRVRFEASKAREVEADTLPSPMSFQWRRNRTALTTDAGKMRTALSKEWKQVYDNVLNIIPEVIIGNNGDSKVLPACKRRILDDIERGRITGTLTEEEEAALLIDLETEDFGEYREDSSDEEDVAPVD